MNDEEFNFIQGQIQAITSVITEIISVLPPTDAARVAEHLAISQEVDNNNDSDDDTPEIQSQARNKVLDAYIELLQAVASPD